MITTTLQTRGSNENVSQESQPHELGWDIVAGWTLTSKQNTKVLHCTPHMVYSDTLLSSTILGSRKEVAQSQWSKLVQARSEQFGAHFNIGTDIVCRMWGMAASPNTAQVATCISMHPTKMLQYQMSAYQHSHILISNEHEDLLMEAKLSSSRLSTGALLFCFSRWLRLRAATKSLDPTDFEKVMRFIDLHSEVAALQQSDTRASRLEMAVHQLQLAVSRRDWLRSRLLQILEAVHSGLRTKSDKSVQPEAAIRARFCRAMLDIPSDITRATSFGSRIIAILSAATRLLQQHGQEDAMDIDQESTQFGMESEACNMCDAEIQLQNLDWAKCTNGHSFGKDFTDLLSCVNGSVMLIIVKGAVI
jgi:hypothetical protein